MRYVEVVGRVIKMIKYVSRAEGQSCMGIGEVLTLG